MNRVLGELYLERQRWEEATRCFQLCLEKSDDDWTHIGVRVAAAIVVRLDYDLIERKIIATETADIEHNYADAESSLEEDDPRDDTSDRPSEPQGENKPD